MFFVFLSILPYACLAGTVWAFFLKQTETSPPFFTIITNGALCWSFAVWILTNALSLINCVYSLCFMVFWVLYASFLVWHIWQLRERIHFERPKGLIPVSIAVICICSLVAALVYPPNMWDVLSYHLPRVMHWLQNHSLAPYPTNIPRQIGMPPFNSMIALQSMAMNGGDYFVNLAQWFAFVGMIAGGMRIAGQLGGNEKVQLLSGLFIATLPNAVIQASNTESSNIVAFWILAMASLFLDWLKARDRENICKLGCCIGFAILSKGSAYVTAFPFVLAIAFFCLRSPRKLLLQGIAAAAIIIALNAPHLARTYQAYGSIVGGTERNILYHPTPGTLAVNIVYNFLLHEPWLLKGPLLGFWQGLPAALGVDVNDKTIFPWRGLEEYEAQFQVVDTVTQNIIQAILLLAMPVSIILRKFKTPWTYSSLVGATFLLYWIFLTWHPWAGRIHTSMFVLAAPLAGLYINSWPKKWLQKTFVIILLASTFLVFQGGLRRLSIFDSNERNFLYNTRNYLYFNNYKHFDQDYINAVNFLASQHPKSIGLEIYDDSFEYPLWAFMADSVREMPRILHITSQKDRDTLKPEYILALPQGTPELPLAKPHILERKNGEYVKVFPVTEDAASSDKNQQ